MLHTLTSGPPPAPAPATISAPESLLTLPPATLTPPWKAGVNAMKLAIGVAPPWPLSFQTTTLGPPPGPAPVMISPPVARSTLATATLTPPWNAGSYAIHWASTLAAPVAGSIFHTITCGPPPGPAPVTISSPCSPSSSPAATDAPPAKPLYAGNENTRD